MNDQKTYSFMEMKYAKYLIKKEVNFEFLKCIIECSTIFKDDSSEGFTPNVPG